MTAPTSSSYGSPADYAAVISGSAQGATAGLKGGQSYAESKRQAKEMRRRTIADLLNAALKRQNNTFNMNQEYAGEMKDYQSQALQNAARSFSGALSGTRR
jgi:serine phosphatase RsbU (regulator of sigma subunit)